MAIPIIRRLQNIRSHLQLCCNKLRQNVRNIRSHLQLYCNKLRQNVRNIRSHLQARRNSLRHDRHEKTRFIWLLVILLFLSCFVFYFLGSLPLPIQQPFEASFIMREVGFVYSSDRENERRLVSSISEIDCVRFDGLSEWSPEGRIAQSSDDSTLIGKTAIQFDLSAIDSRLFIGSCSSLEEGKQSSNSSLNINEVRIPTGTAVDYLIYTPKQDIKLGLVLPPKKESLVRLTYNSKSPLEITIESAILAGGKFLPRARLVIDNLRKSSQTLKLKTQSPTEIASIKASFSKDLTEQWDGFPTHLKIDNFKLYKTEISANSDDNRRISLIKSGSIRFNGKNFVSFNENPEKSAISSATTEIEIIGGKIEHLERLKIAKAGLEVYVTGKSRAIRVNSQTSPPITLFDTLPNKFSSAIIFGLVPSVVSSLGIALLLLPSQKWYDSN